MNTKKFSAILKKLSSAIDELEASEPRDPISELVISFLEWDATTKQADAAYKRLMADLVDHNDLRISQPHEVIAAIGLRYPKAEERVMRMMETLQEVFVREHGMTLERLKEATKKQARAYLDSLPGITPYVSAKVTLFCFSGHAIPVDGPLTELLQKEGVVDEGATPGQVESLLERAVKAGVARSAYAALRAWSDDPGLYKASATPKRKSASRPKTTKRSGTKKTAKSAKSTKAAAKKVTKRRAASTR